MYYIVDLCSLNLLALFKNISCIFLVCASIFSPRSWIIFTVITLNSFLGRLYLYFWDFFLLSLSGTCSYATSFCLAFCNCGFCTAVCRAVVCASAVCPMVDKAGLRGLNGKGNGNPLHYSCLKNPRDGGVWWTAVYGITLSWTRLKRLSSIRGLKHALCAPRPRDPIETETELCLCVS